MANAALACCNHVLLHAPRHDAGHPGLQRLKQPPVFFVSVCSGADMGPQTRSAIAPRTFFFCLPSRGMICTSASSCDIFAASGLGHHDLATVRCLDCEFSFSPTFVSSCWMAQQGCSGADGTQNLGTSSDVSQELPLHLEWRMATVVPTVDERMHVSRSSHDCSSSGW